MNSEFNRVEWLNFIVCEQTDFIVTVVAWRHAKSFEMLHFVRLHTLMTPSNGISDASSAWATTMNEHSVQNGIQSAFHHLPFYDAQCVGRSSTLRGRFKACFKCWNAIEASRWGFNRNGCEPHRRFAPVGIAFDSIRFPCCVQIISLCLVEIEYVWLIVGIVSGTLRRWELSWAFISFNWVYSIPHWFFHQAFPFTHSAWSHEARWNDVPEAIRSKTPHILIHFQTAFCANHSAT